MPLVAAFEIMTSNTAISNAIRQGKFQDIPNIMETNKNNNMRTMRNSLNKLKETGLISQQDWFIRNNLLQVPD